MGLFGRGARAGGGLRMILGVLWNACTRWHDRGNRRLWGRSRHPRRHARWLQFERFESRELLAGGVQIGELPTSFEGPSDSAHAVVRSTSDSGGLLAAESGIAPHDSGAYDAEFTAPDSLSVAGHGSAATATEPITISPAVSSPVLAAGNQVLSSPAIAVGSHVLLPNTAGQVIQIYVIGEVAVQGLNFNIQVADGGPEAAAWGGSIDGPEIQGLDIITGTIFASSNTGGGDDSDGAYPADSIPQWEFRDTTTNSGTVVANGLLATVTIDTTGFTSGSWSLVIGETVNGPTDFAGLAAVITDGTITLRNPNAPPVANADSYTVAVGDSLTTTDPIGTTTPGDSRDNGVLANDTDGESDSLTAILVSGPSYGSLTLNANGTFTYTHGGTENFSDSFTYKANDGQADSGNATVAITISPVASWPVITVGSHVLLPNRAGQVIQIYVTGGYAVNGVDLLAQVADGGTELGGTVEGPAISDIDLISVPPLIFSASNTGEVDPETQGGFAFAQFENRTTTTASGTLTAEGLLATITLDTTDFFRTVGSTWEFDLLLAGVLGGGQDTTLSIPAPPYVVKPSVTNGSLILDNPPVADAGTGYTVGEGDSVSLSGSGSYDPDATTGDSIVRYEWDFDYSGPFDVDASGPSPVFSAATIDGPASRTIALRVTDSYGFTDIDITTVTITDTVGPGDTTPPTADVVDVTPDPRSAAVSSIPIVFSEVVTGLDLADLSLRRDGGDDLLTAAQTLSTNDGRTWTLSKLAGLTGTSGQYVFELQAVDSGITDLAGNALDQSVSDSFQVVGGHPWQNPRDPLDVNDDGYITPLDVLLVINVLNTTGAGPLPLPPPVPGGPPPFLDPSGDDYVTPLDALLVINFLNQDDMLAVAGEATHGGRVPQDTAPVSAAARSGGLNRVANRAPASSFGATLPSDRRATGAEAKCL